jgi:carbonic anhydrase
VVRLLAFLLHIQEILGPNLRLKTSYAKVFQDFPQYLQANARTVSQITLKSFFPQSFKFIIYQSSYNSMLHSQQYWWCH